MAWEGRNGREDRDGVAVRTTKRCAPVLAAIVDTLFAKVQLAVGRGRLRASQGAAFG
jgi:hypothetical protein